MTLAHARKLVFSQKPVFAKLYQEYGDRTWIEYAKENYPEMTRDTRFTELVETVKTLLTPLLGKSKAQTAIQDLNRSRFVSTCDHHGLLWHPFF